jgi:hypothetical protein
MRTVQRLINLMRTMEPGCGYTFFTDGSEWDGIRNPLVALKLTLKRARPDDYRRWRLHVDGQKIHAQADFMGAVKRRVGTREFEQCWRASSASLEVTQDQRRDERIAELLAALQMVCDSGVNLAEPIERAMLDAIAKAKSWR